MNILIVYAHPSKESYTFQVLEQLVFILEAAKHQVTLSDLYAMKFQSEMTEQEYKREGLANLELAVPSDVLDEHKKIEAADCIVFLYPVWWSDCPAILKGWFDRVYSLGYAYGFGDASKHVRPMKIIPNGIVMCTAGHPNAFLSEIGIAESMRNVMIDDRLGKRFEHKEMIILGGTLDLEAVCENHSEIIRQVGVKLGALQN